MLLQAFEYYNDNCKAILSVVLWVHVMDDQDNLWQTRQMYRQEATRVRVSVESFLNFDNDIAMLE